MIATYGWSPTEIHHNYKIYYRPKLRQGNVFIHICSSVSYSVQGSHVTISHDALDTLYKAPKHQTWEPPALAPPPVSDIWWPSLETCSNMFTSRSLLTSTDIYWQSTHVRLASAQYASYWNVFLFNHICILNTMKTYII